MEKKIFMILQIQQTPYPFAQEPEATPPKKIVFFAK